MKAKNRKNFRAVTAALSIAAVALLAFGSIGGARAALSYSDTYTAQIGTQNIGVGLVETTGENDPQSIENGGELLTNLLDENEAFKIGKVYDEKLAVENTGTINTFVRLTIHKYWADPDGNKATDLSPDLIHLEFDDENWIVVENADEPETITLYYTLPLASGETTNDVLESLQVDSELETLVTQTEVPVDGGVDIITTFKYDGYSIGLNAEADAVQTHNAEDAILSAWGVNAAGADSGMITGIN